MSTGAECNFTEKEPNKWFYAIQDYPYGWNEEYTTHGAFPTLDKAVEHLNGAYANPGGYSVYTHENHVHNYKSQKGYDGETVNRCVGCSEDEPNVMECGCVDWHRHACDEFIVHPRIKLYHKTLKALLNGERDYEEVLRPFLEHELESLKRNIERETR